MYIDARGMGASQGEIFHSLETGEGIYRPSYDEFIGLLRTCTNVNLETSDQRGRKSLDTEYQETQREHIICREESTGKAVRFARSGKLLIVNPNAETLWIEVGRGSPGKEPVLAEKDYTVSETLLFGQSVDDGLAQGVKDELNLVADPTTFRQAHWPDLKEQADPVTNPNLFKSGRWLDFLERHPSSAYPDHDSIVRTYYRRWETDKLCEKMVGQAHIFTDTGVSILLRSFPLWKGEPIVAQAAFGLK